MLNFPMGQGPGPSREIVHTSFISSMLSYMVKLWSATNSHLFSKTFFKFFLMQSISYIDSTMIHLLIATVSKNEKQYKHIQYEY